MTKRHPSARLDSRARLAGARLYLLLGPADGDVCRRAARAVRGGVDIVQLRWKGGAEEDVAALARRLVAAVGDEALVIVNDDLEAARRSGAHGLHVGQGDLPVEEARRHLGPDAIVGLSTHDAEAAFGARARGADYVGFGAMFDTSTKERPDVIGPRALADLAGLDVPCFAIGGIDGTNVDALVGYGATRIAVSRAILAADDEEGAARGLREALDRASPSPKNS